MRWRSPPAPSWSIWNSCSSFRSGIWRRASSAWTRSCGTRSATSSAAGCSTAQGASSSPDYGSDETGAYTTPRDIATYAITKEVAAGRGSPHGGVYLVVRSMCRARRCATAFGPVIERLADNGIDLDHSAGRGVADRALSYGRDRGGRTHGEPRARPLRRRRGGGRRQRRQPAVGQRDPRGAGVRRARRPLRRGLAARRRAPAGRAAAGRGGRADPRARRGPQRRCRRRGRCSTSCAT